MKSQYMKILSTAEILQKDDPNDIYKQPTPLDMIKKFVGLDSSILLQDDRVKKHWLNHIKFFGFLMILI